MACTEILKRLKARAAERLCASIDDVEIKNDFVWLKGQQTEISWENLVIDTYFNRISLSEHAHYATPEIHFDGTIEKGHPFAYHVYGTAII